MKVLGKSDLGRRTCKCRSPSSRNERGMYEDLKENQGCSKAVSERGTEQGYEWRRNCELRPRERARVSSLRIPRGSDVIIRSVDSGWQVSTMG